MTELNQLKQCLNGRRRGRQGCLIILNAAPVLPAPPLVGLIAHDHSLQNSALWRSSLLAVSI